MLRCFHTSVQTHNDLKRLLSHVTRITPVNQLGFNKNIFNERGSWIKKKNSSNQSPGCHGSSAADRNQQRLRTSSDVTDQDRICRGWIVPQTKTTWGNYAFISQQLSDADDMNEPPTSDLLHELQYPDNYCNRAAAYGWHVDTGCSVDLKPWTMPIIRLKQSPSELHNTAMSGHIWYISENAASRSHTLESVLADIGLQIAA